MYCLTIALGALFFVMLQHLTGAAWSVTSRRVAETLTLVIPLSAVLFLPVVFGLPHLYQWARPEIVAADPLLQAKQAYLNPQGFYIRAAVCFLIWSLWAVILYRNSVKQDDGGTLELTRAAAKWSAPGMILLALTVSLASFDWLMSLDPHWFSTMFGVYIWAGSGLAGFAAITLVLLAFRRDGHAARVGEPRALSRPREMAVRAHRVLGLYRLLPVHADLVRKHAGGDRVVPRAHGRNLALGGSAARCGALLRPVHHAACRGRPSATWECWRPRPAGSW